jgi:ribonuclease Z|tara:strand:+ start:673 stop:1566 length:894 start_codon:yes stop_codon:yes gene_type:complete
MKTKITFLGTGSATPTAKRNHTGIYLQAGKENILIDCGEGIQRQFRKAKLNPGKLTKILITHWHGDHTLGIVGLLETLAMAEYSKTLKIYGPKGTKEKIRLFETIYGNFKIDLEVYEVSGKFIDEDDFFIESGKMVHGIPANAYSFVIKDKLRLNKSKIKKLKLPNSPLLGKLQNGKDITFEGKKIKSKDVSYIQEGKKISIILDTLMNENAVKLAKNSDLIICEASFLSSEKEKIKEYKHLTAKQAGEIAKKSKSKKLCLVHISQRHEQNKKEILTDAKKFFKDTTIPNDLDLITI